MQPIVITAPPNGTSGLGPTPTLRGTAEPGYHVRIVVANYGTFLTDAVADATGNWVTQLTFPNEQWLTISGCYTAPNPPSYSAPISLQA